MRGRYYVLVAGLIALAGCAEPMTRTQKGAAIGTGAGAATGAVLGQAIGRDTSSTLIGAAVGAVVGGATGGFVGNYMDKQEAAMRQELANVEGANIQRNLDTLIINFKSDLLFAVNSAEVKAGFADELARVAKVVNQYPQTTLLVAGGVVIAALCALVFRSFLEPVVWATVLALVLLFGAALTGLTIGVEGLSRGVELRIDIDSEFAIGIDKRSDFQAHIGFDLLKPFALLSGQAGLLRRVNRRAFQEKVLGRADFDGRRVSV